MPGAEKTGDGVDKSHLVPCTYVEDFEAGELRAWASYPPNQDPAYDPYVYPEKFAGQFWTTKAGFAGVFVFPAASAVLKIKIGGRPARLRLNGEPADRFTYSPGTGVLSVSLAAGKSRIEVTNAR